MVLGIILTIITAIGSIVGAVVDTGKAVLDTIMSFFQSIFSLLQSFVNSAPTPMKVVIFLFFLLTFGNIFSNFFLSTRYACNGNNVLYQTDNIGTAMTLMLKTQFQDLSVGDRNSYIVSNFNQATQSASPTTIKCTSSRPKLYFYSVDVLDYKTWMLLLVLVFGAPIIWGYYTKMGALN
jgi:H+/Cl- antiporter ClcA